MAEIGYNNFQNAFSHFVEDGVVNKTELNKLKELAKAPDIKDDIHNRKIVDIMMEILDTNQTSPLISRAVDPKTKKPQLVKFDFTPNYNEEDKIEGTTPSEIVSNITQNDGLKETKNDGNRCAPSSLLNAYLLMGGKFEDMAKKFEVGTDLTYKNVHLLQEKLYNVGNTNSKAGFSSEISDDFINPKAEGELPRLAEKMGMKVKPLTGYSLNKFNFIELDISTQRKGSVDKFFKANPTGVISILVKANDSGELRQPSRYTGNHAVVVFKKDNDFYLADTGGLINADKKSVKKLSEQEVNDFVYTNEASVLGLSMK